MPLFKKQTIWHKLNEIDASIIQSMSERTLIKIELKSKSICITKLHGVYYAFDDKCPHQGASLSNGECTGNGEIICSWHKYAYDIKSGKSKNQGGGFMNTYQIEKRDDGFYLGIEKIQFGLWQ
jgi:nitrite reductase/ring-hydroxylating ferredoxin subunit